MCTPEALDILNRAAAQWDRTEALLKRVEVIDNDVFAPGINELRYAGRRLVDAVREAQSDKSDPNRVLAYVLEVEQFCFRAQHDCIDAIIASLDERIQLAEETFGYSLLLSNFPQYMELRHELNSIGKVVIQSRGHRGQRAEIYNEIEEKRLPYVLELVEKLNSSEEILKAIALKEKSDDADRKKSMETAERTLFWTRVAAIFAVLAIPFAWYMSNSSSSPINNSTSRAPDATAANAATMPRNPAVAPSAKPGD